MSPLQFVGVVFFFTLCIGVVVASISGYPRAPTRPPAKPKPYNQHGERVDMTAQEFAELRDQTQNDESSREKLGYEHTTDSLPVELGITATPGKEGLRSNATVYGVIPQAAGFIPPGGVFSMQGRYNRARYFGTMLVSALCTYLLAMIFEGAAGAIASEAGSSPTGNAIMLVTVLSLGQVLVGLAGMAVMACQAVKRLHDINHPGWHYWLLLIPIAGLLLAVPLLIRRGTEGPNAYGADPLARS